MVEKKKKSFNLKKVNADKIEKISYETKVFESTIVDELIEGIVDGN